MPMVALQTLLGLLAVGLAAGCGTTPPREAAPGPAAPVQGAESPEARRQALVARGRSLELKTEYVPLPGDGLTHHASGFAKTMCSAVFVTGLDLDFAAEHVGYFTAPYAVRKTLGRPLLDRAAKTVSVQVPGGPTRVAVYTGDQMQGCVTLPEGKDRLGFTPKRIARTLPDASTTPWPMGDVVPEAPLPAGVDQAKLDAAVDAAFANPDGHTAAFVVTHKGRLLAERYADGITHTTPLESWSMGKSVSGTVLATLIRKGVYRLDQPAPFPEWQEQPDDPRQQIRIMDIMRMSSGLRIISPSDPDYDPKGPYPDHLYLYTGSVDSFRYAATRPPQWPPNTVGRYRNTDPVLANYLTKLGVATLGEDYLTYPQRAVFDKVGVRTMVLETDPFGNYLTQGYEYASARDWARLGNLYLTDGVVNGERLLPEGYVKYAMTLAPAWEADGRKQYAGGFLWINGEGTFPVPNEAVYFSGAGGQTTLIIPSHDLVVVRLGHFKGQGPGGETFRKALAILMEAIPAKGAPTN
jgi:CubicO group peptidase (beta-lactamase class C family)